VDDERICGALIELGFACNDCIAEAERIIDHVRAEVAGLDRRASLLLRAVTAQTTAEALRHVVLRHLDALAKVA
jgi:hypothetical protein